MSLTCWYCGKTHFKNRKSLYRHWGWCAAYREFKASGVLPAYFGMRKQRYIRQQRKHPMPEYLEKYPVDIL